MLPASFRAASALMVKEFRSIATRGMSHTLPRTRSVEQEQTAPGGGPARSPDAPLDPFEKRHRDTQGMTEAEVDKEVKAAVARAGARATEALSGRADQLHDNPAFHMNETTRENKHDAFGDWAGGVVGDGLKETVKTGTQKAKDALKKMFEPSGGHGVVGGKADHQVGGGDSTGSGGNVLPPNNNTINNIPSATRHIINTTHGPY